MSQQRIFVVEDEGIVSLDIQNQLRRAGYITAGTAASGPEAIEQALSLQPDLILMDIKLQGQMDGIAAADQIRASLDVPIVYLTAYADEVTLARAAVTAVFGYLLKPFKERELIATIEMALSRHRLERQLKESEQWFSTTLTSISDAVIATDEQGRVRFINPVAETLTGWQQPEAVGIDTDQVFRVFDAANRQLKPCPVRQVLETGKSFLLQDNALLVTRSNGELTIDYSAAPIRNEQGKTAGVVLIFRDLTGRKKAEELLLQAQKLQSLGVLAGSVAHDFNNLLVAILGQISLAQAKLPEDNLVIPHLVKAMQAAEQAAESARQLLAYSGRGQFRRQPLSLNKQVQQSQPLLATSLPGRIEIELHLNETLPLIDADPLQIQQVIMNLTLNAAEDIGDQAGVIMLRTGVQTVNSADVDYWRYTGKALSAGEYVMLEVADTGCGIPSDLMAKVFEPFFTTKPAGRGLGLSAVLGVVRGHQGGILLDNQPGSGAVFKLLFPVSQQQPLPQPLPQPPPVVVAAPPAVTDERIGTQKVLVIDDESFVREAIAATLDLEGITVMTAPDGLAGITVYQEHMAEIGLVLLDLSMPVMDGAQAFQRLQEINPLARVVLMSGYDRQEVMGNHDWQGLADFIPKPFAMNILLEVVTQHMRRDGDGRAQSGT